MIPQLKKGFTLIELLVVITIIGILATGATAVYTSQIQKARDTTRVNDIKALQSWIEQSYQDDQQYPGANVFITSLSKYMQKFPKDSKFGQPCYSSGTDSADCGYAYKAESDDNEILLQTYEISTAFENSWNVSSKATTDKGNDNVRYETWTPKSVHIDTKVAKDSIGWNANSTWALAPDWNAPSDSNALIVIFWS